MKTVALVFVSVVCVSLILGAAMASGNGDTVGSLWRAIAPALLIVAFAAGLVYTTTAYRAPPKR